MNVYLVRDSVILRSVADHGISLGPARWSISHDRSSFDARLYTRGDLRIGDWLQVADDDGTYLGSYKYTGSRIQWAGHAIEQLELRSADGVLELAQVWLPGPMQGIHGDAVRAGQPLLATAQDICQALGLECWSPSIDLVAVSDYGWDIGTSYADVVSDILAACGMRWVPGRRGEVLVYAPPTAPTSTIDAEEVISLDVRPLWEQVANVVVAQRKAAAHGSADVAATAIWDDPSSITSIQRFGPRTKVVDTGPVSADLVAARAETELAQSRQLGGEIEATISYRTDIWPGDRVRLVGLRELGDIDMSIDSVEYEQGRATINITGTAETLEIWDI